jgi:hypothetical protein
MDDGRVLVAGMGSEDRGGAVRRLPGIVVAGSAMVAGGVGQFGAARSAGGRAVGAPSPVWLAWFLRADGSSDLLQDMAGA